MAAAVEVPFFSFLSEVEVRQWVEANPGRVNDRDRAGFTPLIAAVHWLKDVSLITWLLDEKGADVNGTTVEGSTPLHLAPSPDIVTVLLARGADPTRVSRGKWSPLIRQAMIGIPEVMARLLQDPRVRAIVNMQNDQGDTALHCACKTFGGKEAATLMVHLLLQSDADPLITNDDVQMPLDVVRHDNPNFHATIGLLEQYPAVKKDAEKASLFVKARLLAVAATSHIVAPSSLQQRIAQGQPLPRVALMLLTDGQNNGGEDEEGRKLRTTLAFMCGLGRDCMPRDVFRVVMDLLMPSWDPLRRKDAAPGQSLGRD